MKKTPKTNVIITGGAGLIGSVLIDKLSSTYEISSLDVKPADGVQSFIGDLSDADSILPAFKDQDVIVHLAADPRAYSEWDSNLANNFIGTYNVFEAARQCGVRKVIFASSNHVCGGYYLDEPWKHIRDGNFGALTKGEYPLIDESHRVRPDGYYGTAKAFGEALGSYYADYHNIHSIHLRIGWVISDDDPSFSPYALSLWLSHRDCAQIVRLSIEAANSLRYAIFYATSDNKWKIFDITNAKNTLGYTPEDGAAEDLRLRPPSPRDR